MKFIKYFSLTLLFFFSCSNAYALVELESEINKQHKAISVTSFLDYPPFGEVYTPTQNAVSTLQTIYDPFIQQFAQKYFYVLDYSFHKDYSALITDILQGKIDLILGIYYDTKIYQGIEYVYPSILNNPMVAVMLPNRINEVKKMSDLQNLKGGMDSREHLADYVSNAMKKYNIVYADNSEALYKKLFTGEIDYVFTSQFYGLIQLSKLGIRNQVSLSKKSLWDMPLFIGISKLSRYRKALSLSLSRTLQSEKHKKDLENYLISKLRQIEQENIGVVPPAFAKK